MEETISWGMVAILSIPIWAAFWWLDRNPQPDIEEDEE